MKRDLGFAWDCNTMIVVTPYTDKTRPPLHAVAAGGEGDIRGRKKSDAYIDALIIHRADPRPRLALLPI